MSSAPAEIRFCSRCGAAMRTRTVGGRPRRWCPGCGHVHFPDPKVAVGAMVLRGDRLLLVRRAMEPERGRWSLPAGFLDPGEDPAGTAEREVLEETGVRVRARALLEVFAASSGAGANLFLLYAADDLGGGPRAGDDASAAAFFDRGALPDLAFPSTHAAVRRWCADTAG